MTPAATLSLVGMCMGFVAAVFLCVAVAFSGWRSMYDQAGTPWDFNEPLYRSLAKQQACNAAGVLLLSFAFVAQLLSVLLPLAPDRWGALPWVVAALTLISSALVGWWIANRLYGLAVRHMQQQRAAER